MRIGNIELSASDLIEYAGSRALQRIQLSSILEIEPRFAYPVCNPTLNLLAGVVLLSPILAFPYIGISNYLESGFHRHWTFEGLSSSLIIAFLFLPVWGSVLLWPLRKKKWIIKVNLGKEERLLDLGDIPEEQVKQLVHEIGKRKNSNQTSLTTPAAARPTS